MKRFLVTLGFLGLLGAAVPHLEEVLHAATCTGSAPCNACKNCRYCKHCAKEGGTCGVCRKR
jgi:hypothetical protein